MIQRPRGTRDILPPDTRLWNRVEAVAREVFSAWGAEEIRTPAFEHTELFVRSVGETTDIGENVKIYQGVTLGALSFPKDERGKIIRGAKRHPTLEDGVVIYAGATILGGNTVIGEGAVIGGNTWVIESVAPHTKVLNETKTVRIDPGGKKG